MAIDAVGEPRLPSKNGSFLIVSVADDGVVINFSSVDELNVLANNGIIHIINEVLLPDQVVHFGAIEGVYGGIKMAWSGSTLLIGFGVGKTSLGCPR